MLKVECYTSSKISERPVAFFLSNSRYKVEEILDRWYGEGSRYFKRKIFKIKVQIIKITVDYSTKYSTRALKQTCGCTYSMHMQCWHLGLGPHQLTLHDFDRLASIAEEACAPSSSELSEGMVRFARCESESGGCGGRCASGASELSPSSLLSRGSGELPSPSPS